MILVAIDPDTKIIGYSIWIDGSLVNWGGIKHDSAFIDNITTIALSGIYNEKILVIEGQWLHPKASKRNVLTFERLVEVRTTIVTIFELYGWKSVMVSPQKWQTNVLQCSAQTKRKERKQLALRLAEDLAGTEINDQNVADAICIGYWAIKNGVTDEELVT